MTGPAVALTAAQVSFAPGARVQRGTLAALVVALVGGVGAVALRGADPVRFHLAWLLAWLYFLSLALGALSYVLIQLATRAGASVVVRRLGETVMATLPLFALLFLPVALGMGQLFEWSHADEVARDALLRHKRPYLNPGFFILRAAVYFAVWSAIAWYCYRRSIAQDRSGDHAITRQLQTISPPALAAVGLTVTFAAFDWIMSLRPHWGSTIFGGYFWTGGVVGNFAVMIVLTVALRQAGLLREVISAHHFHDLGKWLFAFTAFWAYLAFCQFMLIWYANIPEETVFFAARWRGGFQVVTLLLVLGHFAVPFLFLLSREVKRRPATLVVAAAWMLVFHLVDLYWLVMAQREHATAAPRLVDAAALLCVGGLFVAALLELLRRRALVPVGDPRLRESLAFHNE